MNANCTITVSLPYPVPTLNEVISLAKMQNRGKAYAGMKKRHTDKLAAFFDYYINTQFKWIELSINWGMSNRRSDPDNIAAGVKFILDGMVKAGVIKNDGWKQVKKITHTFSIEDEIDIAITMTGEKYS